MKKITLISVILFFTGLSVSLAQSAKVNPIPFYNYSLTEEYAAFQETGSDELREKRDMNVVVTNSGDALTDVFAKVTIVEKNTHEVLGTYIVFCDNQLTVGLPKGKWGVVVECNWDVIVSVWISKSVAPALNL